MKPLFSVFIFFMLAFLVTGCYEHTSGPENFRISPYAPTETEPAHENQTQIPEKVVTKPQPSCEEWAASMFPYTWVFSQDVTQDIVPSREIISLKDGTWLDGSTIKGLSSTKVELGSKPGENINYYYSRAIFVGMNQSQYGYAYSERVIGKDGVVLGYNNFKIQPVFKAVYDTTEEEKDKANITIKMRYLGLEVVEPNFILCEKVG